MEVANIGQVPILENAPDILVTFADFLNLMEDVFEKDRNILQFAKDMDAYTTVMFNHSANVAFQFYNVIKDDKDLTKDEIREWTVAAFVHDVGKLTTPLSVLNSQTAFLNPDGTVNQKAVKEKTIMMRHSIDGLSLVDKYQLSDRMKFAAIGHHVDAKAIENGPEGEFEGATDSRDTWKTSYTNQYGNKPVENLLMQECSWVTEKDKSMIEVLSAIDSTEAMHAKDRSYKPKKDWDTIRKCHISDYKKGALDKKTVDKLVKNKLYTESFESLESLRVESRLRYFIFKKGKDLPYQISNDKMNEIINDPQCGISFFKQEENGSYSVDMGDGCLFDVSNKEEIPFIIEQAKPALFKVERSLLDSQKLMFIPVQQGQAQEQGIKIPQSGDKENPFEHGL